MVWSEVLAFFKNDSNVQAELIFTKKVGDKNEKHSFSKVYSENQIINHTLVYPTCVFKQGIPFLHLMYFLTERQDKVASAKWLMIKNNTNTFHRA
jgi:hypothetical protein